MKKNCQQIKESIEKIRNEIYEWKRELHTLDLNFLLQITLQWFDCYQWEEPLEKMVWLYKALIKEELDEASEAWYNMDIVELLDAYVDYLWVTIWYIWFKALRDNENVIEWKDKYILNEVTEWVNELLEKIIVPKGLFSLAWLEIAYSNWTKSLEKRDENDPEGKAGKIIKWPNYVKPDLNKVFDYIKKTRE